MLLRPYQDAAIRATLSDLSATPDVLLVAATGAGKTVMFLELIRRWRKPGQRVLILAHRQELVTQPIERIKELFPDWDTDIGIVGIGQAKTNALLTVATVQALRNSKLLAALLASGPIDLLVCDEAHHATAASYRKVIANLRVANPEMRHLGVTATPFREDENDLGQLYQRVSARITIAELVRDRYLVRPTWDGVYTGISLKGMKPNAQGLFNDAELAERYDTAQNHALIVRVYQERGENRQTIAFVPSVAGAQALAAAFQAAGVSALPVWGEMSSSARSEALMAFQRGDVRMLVNCAVLTEGVDLPAAACIIMARPTKSDTLYTQCIGRGLRPAQPDANGRAAAGENCLILDFMPVEYRNVVMAGDILGLSVKESEAMRLSLAEQSERNSGDRVGSFTFTGNGVQGIDLNYWTKQLNYLEISKKEMIIAQIREMDAQGKTRKEIRNAIGGRWNYLVVEVLGRKARPAQDRESAIAQIREMDAQGKTRREMKKVISDKWSHLVFELLGRERRSKRDRESVIAQIKEMDAQGKTRKEIGRAIGGWGYLIVEVLGRKARPAQDRESVIAQIREMDAQEKTRTEIGKAIGSKWRNLIVDVLGRTPSGPRKKNNP